MDTRTELDVARLIASGELQSPQQYENVTLFDIRITGTGAAFRTAIGEFVYRNPDNYLNEEFLARCNGLPVIWFHPDKSLLNHNEFQQRIIGTIFLPYIKDDEVWGVAKVFDEDAIKTMIQSQMSTSPGVLFNGSSDNKEIELADGKTLLIEGKPCLLDHIAICEQGVWDKLEAPTGIRIDSQTEVIEMTPEEIAALKAKLDAEIKARADSDEAKVKADSDNTKAVLDALSGIGSRLDALSTRMDSFEEKKAKVDSDEEEKEKEAKAKADAEEEEEKKAKADSETLETKRRLDAMERVLKSDEDTDYAAMADAQIRADDTMHLFGQSAPRPLRGETVLAYRQRLVKPLQQYSSVKDVDLSKVTDPAVFKHLESVIYNDAQAAAHDPKTFSTSTGKKVLREVTKKVGRVERTEFMGEISCFTDQFKQPAFSGKIRNTDAK